MRKLVWAFLCIAVSLMSTGAWAATYVFDGGALSGSLTPWTAEGFIYPQAFDVTAPGGIDIIYYDVDGALMRFNNIDWGGSLKGTGLVGVTAGTEIDSIDVPNNSVWSNMLNQNTPSSHDWNSNPTSTIGPDGVPLTVDDTRSWLFQSWYRQSTGPKTGHPGYGDPAYNTESYVTPNLRFPAAQAHNATFYNTFDLRLHITSTGGGNYIAERWVRMHNSAAKVEGATWIYNLAMNNSSDAWRHVENEMGIYTFPMSNLDLTAVHPFVGIGNWETTSIQGISWGSVVVTGTPALLPVVWVDDDWLGFPNGTEITLPNGETGYAGYDAFSAIQDGVNAVVPGGTVNVEPGTYVGQIVINKSLSLIATGDPVIHPQNGALLSYTITEGGGRCEPIIFAYGGVNDGSGNISGPETIEVTISGLNIDGNNAGTANTYTAFLIRNCLASYISDNNITNMLFSSGNPETCGILVYGNSNITIDHNTIRKFSRNGITLNGDGGPLPDPIGIVSYNVIVGEGLQPEGAWAQNGIQMAIGAGGSILNNEVSDIFYTGPGYCASALLIDTPIDGVIVSGNNVHDAQAAMYAFTANNLVLSNNTFINDIFAYVYAGSNTTISGNTFTGNVEALYFADAPTAMVTNNTFSENSYTFIIDGACSNLTFSENNITGSYDAAAYVVPYDVWSPEGLVFSGNNISGNAYGIYNATTNMIDATGNWWGDVTGPQEEMALDVPKSTSRPMLSNGIDQHRQPGISNNRPGNLELSRPISKRDNRNPSILGNGNAVSSLVDYSPWWGANYIGDPHSSSWNWGLNNSNNTTIQEGINKVLAHDFIQVYPGTFNEHVTVNKAITLTGDRGETTEAGPGPEAPILDGTGLNGTSAFLFSQDISDVTVEGFEIRNYGPDGNTDADGFVAWNSHTANITIRDNYLHHLGYAGVLVGNGWGGSQGLHDNWNVSYNIVNNFAGYGLDLENAQNSTLSHNQISSPSYLTQGIMVLALADPGNTISCSGNQIINNQLIDFPDRGICLVTWALGATSRATLTNITASGNIYTGNYDGICSWKLGDGINVFSNLTINGNSITVNDPESAGYAIDLYDAAGVSQVNDNSITLTGTLGPAASFFHGLNIGGAATGNLTFSNLQLNGNNLGASNVGIRLRGTLPSTSQLQFTGCTVTGFAQGVRADALPNGIGVNLYHSSIEGNSQFGISNAAGAPIIAQNNWWGSYCGPFQAISNPDGGGDAVSNNVTYDPWCEPTFTNCSYSNSNGPLEVWVDDDYSPLGSNDGHFWCFDAFNSIQAAVDAVADGGTVNVMTGTYQEQVAANKSIHLIGNGNPIIQSPSGTLATYMISESGAIFEPIVIIYGGTNNGSGHISGSGTIQASIAGFNIDGRNRGAVNRFTGIIMRNCLNSGITYNNIHDMLFSSGNPQTSDILVYGNSNVTIDHNTINDFSRGGIIVNGDDGPLPDPHAVISNNIVIGEGLLPLGHWAQNGIQFGFGAGGSMIGNEVSDIAIDDPNWSASAISIYDPAAGVSLSGNNIHDCQAGMNAYFCDGLHLDGNNNFSNNEFIFIYLANNVVVDNSVFTDNFQGLYLTAITNFTGQANTFTGNGYGIVIDSSSSNLEFTNCIITGNDSIGVTVQPYGESPENVTFSGNNISGNAFGVVNITTNMLHAAGNWWGDADGPNIQASSGQLASTIRPPRLDFADDDKPFVMASPRTNSTTIVAQKTEGMDRPTEILAKSIEDPPELPRIQTSGDDISTNVDYSPWWKADYVNDPHSINWEWYLDVSNSSTLQEAVDIAGTGDLVSVLPAIYSGEGNRDIDYAGKNIQLVSTGGPLAAIIDCQSVGRAFYFHNGEDNTASVDGFTIKNGYASGNGGAILCENSSSPQILNCLIIHNLAAGYGGAIYLDNSNAYLLKNTIVWNHSDLSGGGLGINNAGPVVQNTIIWQDTSISGLEIYLNGSTPTITYNDITGGWQGEGNIDCDPRFCDAYIGNFQISDISCCLNSGYNGITIGAFELGCSGDFLPGDVNNSGEVNGIDVVYFVRYLKDTGLPIPPPIWRADANGNCMVNGVDVVYLVNYFKGSGGLPINGHCGQGTKVQKSPENNDNSSSIK